MKKKQGELFQANDEQSDIAVLVEHVSKSFRLPHNRQNTLKGSLVNLIGRGDRTYEVQRVLRDVSFEIKKGEFFGIVGRNGSGKSTLLKMLAGIYTPSEGKIVVNGTLTPFIELGVGFNQELTGRENVYLNGALLGFNDKEVDAMYDDIIHFAELEQFMDQKLKNYSSGMQVRLAFSIAIRARSGILLLDEVLAVGDAAFQAKCFDYFYELKHKKATVIFVSHDRGALERFCTNGVLIDKGRIVHRGEIRGVLDAYSNVVLDQMAAEGGHEDYEKNQKSRRSKRAIKLISVTVLKKKTGEAVQNADFNDPLSVKVKIEFLSKATDPIIGMTLWRMGIDNHAVYACNNLTENMGESGEFGQGQYVEYGVDLPRYINDGEYIIEIGIADKSGTNFILQDRDAARFKVFGSNNPHAIMANPANMKLKR